MEGIWVDIPRPGFVGQVSVAGRTILRALAGLPDRHNPVLSP